MSPVKNYFPYIWAACHGAGVGLLYWFLQGSFHDGGLVLFTLSVSVVAIVHLPILYKHWNVIVKKGPLLRGLLFGSTQICFFEALAKTSAAAALTAGTIGTLFGIGLGMVLLGEVLKPRQRLGLVAAVIGILLNLDGIYLGWAAVIGGLFQGSFTVLTRKYMRDRVPAHQANAVMFIVSSLVCIAYLSFTYTPGNIFIFRMEKVLMFAALISSVHYSLCYIYRHLDTQKVAVLTLTRLPATGFADWIGYGVLLSPFQWGSIGFAMLGAAIVALGDSRLFRK